MGKPVAAILIAMQLCINGGQATLSGVNLMGNTLHLALSAGQLSTAALRRQKIGDFCECRVCSGYFAAKMR
ncbi:hypothetical protein [Halomicronema sp. CCY15110]|uniref:hypothetical protein n=1 Tax=Halomicronema sp. CCY15110 TaxID=2767773 RepID=UPI00194E42E9|nr:hypothetical protein [Halomicronema sp. CCY15110]